MAKKIYDNLHGFIYFDDLEDKFLSSRPMQRLYCIHQLGAAYLVYPGGNHKRFEHSIGTMKIATDIFDRISKRYNLVASQHERARRLLRLAALSHDLGHLPFSHTAEALILPENGHEEWTEKFLRSDDLRPYFDSLGHDACESVIKIALGPELVNRETFSPLELLLSEIITGDNFGADRIDYLLRDARATGLAYGHFDHIQLIESLYVDPITHQLRVDQNGIESAEALLLARYFMHKRLYEYPSVKAYNFHLARFMHRYYQDNDFLASPDKYLLVTDYEILVEIHRASRDKSHPSHEEALRLTKQKERFEAIKLPPSIDEKQFLTDVKPLYISPDSIGWDFSASSKGSFQLSFPQLNKEGDDLSIRCASSNWVYIDPTYRNKLNV